MNIINSMIDFFSPCWKTVSSKPVELEMISPIMKREWKEDAVLVIQKSRSGRERAFIIKCGNKEPIDMDFVRAFLEVES